MTKQELRQLIRQRKQLHSVDESVVVTARLRRDPHYTHARTLLLYSALPDEVQTQPLLDELLSQGKTILLPRVVSDTNMELRRYTGPQDLQPGAYHIMEPTGQLFTDYKQIDIAIIPGMAFDREGHRLGRGKGYYDRFLRKLGKVTKVGVCYDFQIQDNLPWSWHDVRMDKVITPSAIYER
jgi:5-formyltetrahydrofolate cyclo-ligase